MKQTPSQSASFADGSTLNSGPASRSVPAGVSRREVLRVATAAVLFTAGSALVWVPDARAQGIWDRLEGARALLGDRTPREGGVSLNLPLVSEDGSSVALEVTVEGGEGDRSVESVHLFATRNPNEELAVFRFSEKAVPARVATRVRLNESQTVVALAQLRNGEFLVATRDVRVTVSGCLADAGTYDAPADPQPRVRVPGRVRAGEAMEVLTMVNHPMETGLREDGAGNIVPRNIIHTFVASLDGEAVFEAELHPAVSANPYLRFHLTPTASGQLHLRWVDDSGESVTATTEVEVA